MRSRSWTMYGEEIMGQADGDALSVEGAWSVVGDLYCTAISDCILSASPEVEDELLFCLLGGFGVTYELGRSAATAVRSVRPFSEDWREQDLFKEILGILNCPQFEPRKRDGTLRRYRFPAQKASAIVRARRWIRDHDPLLERLRQLPTARDRRVLLLGCPGVGYKTASWVLRNTGLGNTLAIIDIHVLRALEDSERVSRDIRMPQDYEMVEVAFLEWCAELDAPSAAFDLFLWQWQRGSLRIV